MRIKIGGDNSSSLIFHWWLRYSSFTTLFPVILNIQFEDSNCNSTVIEENKGEKSSQNGVVVTMGYQRLTK